KSRIDLHAHSPHHLPKLRGRGFELVEGDEQAIAGTGSGAPLALGGHVRSSAVDLTEGGMDLGTPLFGEPLSEAFTDRALLVRTLRDPKTALGIPSVQIR